MPRLLAHLADCDVLITHRDSRHRRAGRLRKLISWADRALVRLLFGLPLKDLHWIRFFRRSVLDQLSLRSTSPSIDTEMVVGAEEAGGQAPRSAPGRPPPRDWYRKGGSLRYIVRSTGEIFALRFREVRSTCPLAIGATPDRP